MEKQNDLDTHIKTLWDFLSPSTPIEKLIFQNADAIFVFGGIGTEIPEHAANLYHAHIAPKVLVTGKSGIHTHTYFDEDEYILFKNILVKNNVLESDIILEPHATHAGENVTLGMKALQENGIQAKCLVLVCRSFMMLRALATFKKQFPHIICFPSPSPMSSDDINLPKLNLAKRLLGEFERFEPYYNEGFIEQINVPEHIQTAIHDLREVLRFLS